MSSHTDLAKLGYLPIDGVKVEKYGRLRADVGDLSEIVDSIRELGLLHPVGVKADGTLVYGERRLEACRKLGWSQIPVMVVDYDVYHAKLAEFHENKCRKPLDWPEEVQAIDELDSIHRVLFGQKEPGRPGKMGAVTAPISTSWSTSKTAEVVGKGERQVQDDLRLAKALKTYPEIKQAATKEKALEALRVFEHDPDTPESILARVVLARDSHRYYEDVLNQIPDALRSPRLIHAISSGQCLEDCIRSLNGQPKNGSDAGVGDKLGVDASRDNLASPGSGEVLGSTLSSLVTERGVEDRVGEGVASSAHGEVAAAEMTMRHLPPQSPVTDVHVSYKARCEELETRVKALEVECDTWRFKAETSGKLAEDYYKMFNESALGQEVSRLRGENKDARSRIEGMAMRITSMEAELNRVKSSPPSSLHASSDDVNLSSNPTFTCMSCRSQYLVEKVKGNLVFNPIKVEGGRRGGV